MSVFWTIVLIGLLECVHFLADFTPLSRPYMLKAKQRGWPIAPIMDHALVHALLMLPVLAVFALVFGKSQAWYWILPALTVGQLLTHTLLDTLKGRLTVWRPVTGDIRSSPFWVVFGLDQLGHHLVILGMALMMAR